MGRQNSIFKIALGVSFWVAAIFLNTGNFSRADSYNPSLYLGVPVQLMPQMYVYVEVLEETSPGVYYSYGPTGSGPYGLTPYNYCLLDTGANSILIVDAAAAELESRGYQTEGLFWEVGVGGYTEYDVSASYRFAVTGTNNVTHYLDGTSGQGVRILSSPDTYLGAPLDDLFGGIPGLVGMPAMTGRVTTMDMTNWVDSNDFFDLLEVGSNFSNSLPSAPSGTTRYTVALDNRIQFSAEDGLPDGAPPNSPLPEYADVPFLTAGAVNTGANSVEYEKYGTFLLDTGAQFTIISRRMAFALGLDEDGDGDLDEHAFDSMEVGGVGGTKTVPVMLVEELRMPTEQGIDLVWADTSGDPESLGVQVLVMDLFECGDIDFNGVVDATDIATITSHLGTQVTAGDIPAGDINGDGWVNGSDLAIAQSQLGETAFIDGVCGIDMLNSGVDIDYITLEPVGNPFFDQIHFDFRNWANGQGTLVLDVDGDYNTILIPDIPGDANGDRIVDGSDATILANYWQQSTTLGASAGDFNGDGFVDGSDATILANYWQYGVVNPTIPGDINGDGYVDGSDATILAAHWLETTTEGISVGDLNLDGIVNGSDATLFASYWNNGTPPSNTAVPEPPMWILLGTLGCFGVFLWYRKKKLKSA